jgi:hypothetical protein
LEEKEEDACKRCSRYGAKEYSKDKEITLMTASDEV